MNVSGLYTVQNLSPQLVSIGEEMTPANLLYALRMFEDLYTFIESSTVSYNGILFSTDELQAEDIDWLSANRPNFLNELTTFLSRLKREELIDYAERLNVQQIEDTRDRIAQQLVQAKNWQSILASRCTLWFTEPFRDFEKDKVELRKDLYATVQKGESKIVKQQWWGLFQDAADHVVPARMQDAWHDGKKPHLEAPNILLDIAQSDTELLHLLDEAQGTYRLIPFTRAMALNVGESFHYPKSMEGLKALGFTRRDSLFETFRSALHERVRLTHLDWLVLCSRTPLYIGEPCTQEWFEAHAGHLRLHIVHDHLDHLIVAHTQRERTDECLLALWEQCIAEGLAFYVHRIPQSNSQLIEPIIEATFPTIFQKEAII